MSLSESQYNELCDACNQLLVASDSTIERISIPWLHVIREHPIALESYKELTNRAGSISAWRRLKYGSRNMAVWLRQIYKAVKSAEMPLIGMENVSSHVDVLFISHLLNPAQFYQADDFYFSSLPSELSQEGLSAVIALNNFSGKSGSYFQGKRPGGTVPRVILGESLSLKGEWYLHKRLSQESRELARQARSRICGLARSVTFRASSEALSNGSLRALRLEVQISELVGRLKPRAIVVIHEGHSWERIAFAAARRADPDILCVAYQHSLIFRLQYAIRQGLPQQYMPDRIMTSGTATKSLLENALALKNIPIDVLGSSRAPQPYGSDVAKSPVGSSRSTMPKIGCLVVPEGIITECNILFEFSIRCAQLCPDVQFIWRLHPLLTFDVILARNAKLRKLPCNIRLSEASLEEDLAVCRLALYRGTTAIVQAVGTGLRPVYLDRSGEMTIDPLYAMPAWRVHVETPREFQEVARVETETPDQDEARRVATEFCKRMFEPFNRRVLVDALDRPIVPRSKEGSNNAR